MAGTRLMYFEDGVRIPRTLPDPNAHDHAVRKIVSFITNCPKCADHPDATKPLPTRQTVEPGPEGLEISLDRTKFRIRFLNETESHVDVVIEPKE